jgi:hypothetical protein
MHEHEHAAQQPTTTTSSMSICISHIIEQTTNMSRGVEKQQKKILKWCVGWVVFGDKNDFFF